MSHLQTQLHDRDFGLMFGSGGFWADCGSSAPPDKLDDTWESYCSARPTCDELLWNELRLWQKDGVALQDEPIDQLHQKGGGDGWRPPMVRRGAGTRRVLPSFSHF